MQIDFTLQQLIEHFTIPDVATLNPELYQRNLALLYEYCTRPRHHETGA